MKQLVLASNNKGKIKELQAMLGSLYEIKTLNEVGFFDDIEENGSTFLENALIKAKTVSIKLNVDAIADDSGLEVEALNGAPGIYSARFCGEHGNDQANNDLLLKKMQNESNRKANFTSAVVLYKTNGEYVYGIGKTYGEILTKAIGNEGFGYDPLFFSFELKKSFGEASSDEKNTVSHRKKAIENLLEKL